jgi:hypothetical protein
MQTVPLPVSIITITDFSFEKKLPLLFDCIRNQHYNNILQWIFIDQSKTPEEKLFNKIIVDQFAESDLSFNILFLNDTMNITDNISGDIIVSMQPDTYYMPTFIQYCVTNMTTHNLNYFCYGNLIISDVVLGKSFMSQVMDIANVVYTKQYMKNEMKGTLNYPSKPMNIIDPSYQLIKLVDDMVNIVFRKLMIATIFKSNDTWQEISHNELPQYIESPTYAPYDIVYFLGGHSIEWDPTNKALGGSEQAVVHLSKEWVKLGKKVAVYGVFKNNMKVDGVDYIVWDMFPFHQKIRNLIVWRHCGITMLLELKVMADNIVVDFHDNFSYTLCHLDQNKLKLFFNNVNKINLKSMYHKLCLEEYFEKKLGIKLQTPVNIILNGVRVEDFKEKNNIVRNPYRFCYCSSYDRGLETILDKIWSHIYKEEPLAELHVYYGMEHLYDIAFKTRLQLLMGQPGVMDHGRQPLETIRREKYTSSFHLYLNNSVAEIDCISIRESLVTGCIPVISRFGVFADRHGIQYDFDPNNDELCRSIALDLVGKMRNNLFMENARNQLLQSNTIITWEEVAKQWLDTM